MEVYEIINNEFGTSYSNNSEIKWALLLETKKFSDSIIESCSENIPWRILLQYQRLSEDLMEKYLDIIEWDVACEYQCFTEEFIERHINDINWIKISSFQSLSENFMEKYSDKIDWFIISSTQKLSENFIKKHIYKLEICSIYKYQKLSEELLDYLLTNCVHIYDEMNIICKYQNLSISFINKYWNEISRHAISEFQKLPKEFIFEKMDKLSVYLINDNWLYKSTEEKKQAVIDTGLYECHDDYFIAYKSIRYDRYSLFNFQYKYEKGGVYESWCDCSHNEDSFGLNVGTKDFAFKYARFCWPNHIIVRCKVRYEDVGRVVHGGEKVRCLKIEILD